jgi:hypothetical protein
MWWTILLVGKHTVNGKKARQSRAWTHDRQTGIKLGRTTSSSPDVVYIRRRCACVRVWVKHENKQNPCLVPVLHIVQAQSSLGCPTICKMHKNEGKANRAKGLRPYVLCLGRELGGSDGSNGSDGSDRPTICFGLCLVGYMKVVLDWR